MKRLLSKPQSVCAKRGAAFSDFSVEASADSWLTPADASAGGWTPTWESRTARECTRRRPLCASPELLRALAKHYSPPRWPFEISVFDTGLMLRKLSGSYDTQNRMASNSDTTSSCSLPIPEFCVSHGVVFSSWAPQSPPFEYTPFPSNHSRRPIGRRR